MEPKNTINLILGIIGLIFFGLMTLILLIIREFGLVVFLIVVEAIIGGYVLKIKNKQS